RIAIAEAELQLVIHRADIKEFRTVHAILLLRTISLIGVIVTCPCAARLVEDGARSAWSLPAVGEEAETAGDFRPHPRHVQRRADDLRVLDLVDLGRPGLLP